MLYREKNKFTMYPLNTALYIYIYITHLWRSMNSRYSSAGLMLRRLRSIWRLMSWNLSAVKSPCLATSSRMLFQTPTNPSCNVSWYSSMPGNRMVRMSFSTSAASLISNTYSLWAKCNFLHAFWYFSRTSSSLRPPRPAGKMHFVDLFSKHEICG